ncbi:hypothetical protein [Xanthobacter autotrophicus]|uniref:hypothetical protein n=1 Tax=Xanthobacter autotrophicus TaxID=280 RepID=UPI00372924B9
MSLTILYVWRCDVLIVIFAHVATDLWASCGPYEQPWFMGDACRAARLRRDVNGVVAVDRGMATHD